MPHHALPVNRLYLASQLSEPAFGAPDTLFYVRMTDGRRTIVRQSLSTGLAEPITAEPLPAGGVGYGNALLAVRENLLVYAAKDNRLHGVDLTTGQQWPLTPAYEGVAAPAISPCGQFVACLAEQGGRCNVLLVDSQGKTLPVKVSTDPWYAFNPTFSPDGTRLAWQEWDEADMPWDEARLQIATLARPTSAAATPYELMPVKTVALGRPRTSYGSPQFSPDGQWLAYTSDETGWRSLWVAGSDGANPVRLNTGEGEVGGPDWVPGQTPMCWSETSQTLYALRHHQSRDTLIEVDWPAQAVRVISTVWTDIDRLALRGSTLAFVAAHPTRPATLVSLDLQTKQESLRATTAVGLLDTASLSIPEVLTWSTTGDAACWGILYRAVGPEAEKGPRPLIVYVHGGPTSEIPLTWHSQAQYFASRGWHYLCVNHRGGTGFGRAYQDLLQGQWGVVDVEDARSGAAHLVERGLADPQRLIITGGSAGGYTTLMALTQHPDFWAAGVSLYGVGDLYGLRQGSHRFEVNYEQGLVGPLPAAGPLWKERSPLTHVKNVRAPVLLFHGTDDKAVPHQQSVDFAEAVRRGGGIAELVSYPGEGHGFVKEANRKDQIEKMERFLDKFVLCQQG